MSNAEDRSSSVNKDTCRLSRPKMISSAVFGSNVSVLWCTGMWIERCREDCCDLSILQAAGEELSAKLSR